MANSYYRSGTRYNSTTAKSVSQALAAMDKHAVPPDCVTDVLYDTASRSWTAMWIQMDGSGSGRYLNGSGRTPEQAILSLVENNNPKHTGKDMWV